MFNFKTSKDHILIWFYVVGTVTLPMDYYQNIVKARGRIDCLSQNLNGNVTQKFPRIAHICKYEHELYQATRHLGLTTSSYKSSRFPVSSILPLFSLPPKSSDPRVQHLSHKFTFPLAIRYFYLQNDCN